MSTDILLAPTVRILKTNTVLVESTPTPHSHNLSERELNAYFRSGAFTIEQALNPLIAAAAVRNNDSMHEPAASDFMHNFADRLLFV